MIKNHIHIIKMGGTIEFIDPSYDSFNKKLLRLDATIESYLKNLIQPHFSFSTETVTEKDSRDITDSDREKLVKAIIDSPHSDVLVTHGTFTMQKTAEFLQESGLGDKKVILTGSMIPIVGFSSSDAGFNLGFAIGSYPSLEPGVYLSMNGGIFHSDEVKKNIDLMRFE